MKKVSVILFLLSVSIFLSSCTLNGINTKTVDSKTTVINKMTADQKVSFDDKKTDFVKTGFTQNQTALDLIKMLPGVTIKGEGQNAFVTGIYNRQADDRKKEYWSLFINDKISEMGAGSYIIKQGDQLEWKIQTY